MCTYIAGSLSDFPDLHVSEEDGKAGDVGLCSVPIACASGDVTVKVKIRMCDSAPGPKLNVEVFVGVVHLLLSPQQLNTVMEIVTGLVARAEGQERSGWNCVNIHCIFTRMCVHVCMRACVHVIVRCLVAPLVCMYATGI